MSDISKCAFKECPLAKECYRMTAPVDPEYQTFVDFEIYYIPKANTCKMQISVRNNANEK